ncbi:MAG: sigma-70 family RNA polymerase sigma factor [Planctomycetes bacterium]|nr:sigma-70 family RNA polymerase sigma factor [Planctomycetota bacterium]
MSSVNAGSVSLWIKAARDGEPHAIQHLWSRYYEKLVRLARTRLRGAPRRVQDEEDFAAHALESFHRGLQCGYYPDVTDRGGLWRLMIALTANKVVDGLRHERRAKRGGGNVVDEGILGDGAVLAEAFGDEPTQEVAVAFADMLDQVLAKLGDETLRQVALMRLDGYSNDEIAQQLGCVERTIERKLNVIRRVWRETDPEFEQPPT